MYNNDRINGSVCYFQSMYLKDKESLDDNIDHDNRLFRNIRDSFSKAYAFGSKEGMADPAFRDIDTAQRFLHGNNLPFKTERMMIKDFVITDDSIPVVDSHIFVSVYPDVGTVNVTVNLRVEGIDTETLVFMRHMQGNDRKLTMTRYDGTVEKWSISQLVQHITDAMGVTPRGQQNGYLVEINDFGGYQEIDDIFKHEKHRLYGIMTGDEGWEHLDPSLAEKRIETGWSSRNFVSVVAFGNAFLLLDLWNSKAYKDYMQHQNRFFDQYYGSMDDYFKMRSPVAGVNHGLFFAVETGVLIKTFSQNVLDLQDEWMSRKKSFGFKIGQMKKYREYLIIAIDKVEDVAISEMGELQNLVMKSLRIYPVIERLRNLLDIIESGLEINYSTQMNHFMAILTIAGLLFSLIQVISIFI